jgi:hypothetical protein
MKCPYCGYFYGWDGEKLEEIKGSEGCFYILPIRMKKHDLDRFSKSNKTDLEVAIRGWYGCPKCGKVFIEV